ncbi:hypothetical protein BDN70DRAFT_997519 [Pholiota conissans]|uniref:GST N-terminal domain-containing protein n=1 Tax=Pholiota conissans TaxID=109636 RepID=A0A9P6CU91_9AGAR|nr:hypothetical protein BDN70DRAFT_997519 [Pholiota conissans]
MTITLYDLVSLTPGIAWSSNTQKTRLCLNFKGIPYRTEWVEWPDIKGVYEKHSLPASSRFHDGSPKYTLPVIYDPSTGATISDSLAIAEYLEKTYPDTPKIFPHGTVGLQAPFEDMYIEHSKSMVPLLIPNICRNIMTPTSLPVYQPYMEKLLGMKMADFDAKSEVAVEKWRKYKENLEVVARWYRKTDGPFLMGDTISWADFVVVSIMMMFRAVWGEDSQEWKDVVSWNEGVWGNLVEELDRYTTVF